MGKSITLVHIETSWLSVEDFLMLGVGFERFEDGHCEAVVRPTELRLCLQRVLAVFARWYHVVEEAKEE